MESYGSSPTWPPADHVAPPASARIPAVIMQLCKPRAATACRDHAVVHAVAYLAWAPGANKCMITAGNRVLRGAYKCMITAGNRRSMRGGSWTGYETLEQI
ncbi:hypothetical protein GCM10009780_22010 [Actinomadura alba]